MARVHYVSEDRGSAAYLRRWSLRSGVDSRDWNGEFVVWAADTGKTFLLSTLAGRTIQILRHGPASVEDIAARLLERHTPGRKVTAVLVATFAERGGESQSLLGVLNELEALGLTRADFI